MSVNKLISIKHTVQAALENMGREDARELPTFQTWAVEGDRKIGSYYSYKKKIAIIDVHNCRATLPCDAVAVLGVLLGDHGCDCGLHFNNWYSSIGLGNVRVTPTQGFIVVDATGGGNSTSACADAYYEIQNNQLVFNLNFSKTNITKLTVQYLGYETDEDGFPLISENHIDAIAQYIEYKAALRTRWNSVEHRIGTGDIQDMRREWNRKCRDARAVDSEPTTPERNRITRMINDPMSGIGMSMFLYQENYWSISY